MRLPAHAVTAFLCLPGLPGCTKAVIDYAGKVEIRDNRVARITHAWRAGDGDMVICVEGWPAERARDSAPLAFHMLVPLALFEDAVGPSPLLVESSRRIRTIVVPAARTGTGCPETPVDAHEIRTIIVEADYFASVSPRAASDEQIERFADPHAADIALFGFEAPSQPPDVALLYRHDEQVFERSRLVWIDPGNKPVKPYEFAYLALPLAFATDVLLVAGIVVVFAVAAAAGA